YQELGSRDKIAEVLGSLAQENAAQGDHATAHALYRESLAICMELRIADFDVTAHSLEGLAKVIVAQGEPAWAARLWGAAEELREGMGTPLWPVERSGYEHAVAAARANLGERAFVTAWAEGRTMTLDAVLAEAAGMGRVPLSREQPSPSPAQALPTYPND